mmetsp:Transcript_45853/g.88304  ORF Transcript_45853/g.88304 Transcript_45853/m.88304 type:complete len:588 (+) Transcript_45853:50-1813(+)
MLRPNTRRAGLVVAIAAGLLPATIAYDLGQDTTLCWRTTVSVSGSTERENCNGAEVVIDKGSLSNPLKEQREHDVQYEVHIPHALKARPGLTHCNVHSCFRRVGFCTPFVEHSPDLAIHSPQLDHIVLNGSGYAKVKSTISLDSGEYTIIAHVSWLDLNGVKHDMARATIRDVEPANNLAVVYGLSIVGGVVALVCLLASCCGLRWVMNRHKELVAIKEKNKTDRRKRVARVLQQNQNLAYPMCLISYSDFKAIGKLITHEEARERGLLRVIDTVESVREAAKTGYVIFISHQWIGQDEPDFDMQHFHCICSSIEALQNDFVKSDKLIADTDEDTRESLQVLPNVTSQWTSRMEHKDSVLASWAAPEAGTMLTAFLNGKTGSLSSQNGQRRSLDKSTRTRNSKDDETWVWIDYTSVPQRLSTLKLLSIQSLPIYAGLSTYFLIVTPPVENYDIGQTFDLRTYLHRGWCRLECWARFLQSTDRVFVAVGSERNFCLKDVHHEASIFRTFMAVFTADFNDVQDKKQLVDTVVTLYGHMFHRRFSLDKHMQASWKRVHADKHKFFPRSYFHDLIEIAEELVEGGAFLSST